MTFHPFNYKVRDIISRNLQILKNNPVRSAIILTDNPPISFIRNKNIRDNLVRSALRQNQSVPFLALVLVLTLVCSSTLAHLFPDLIPISLFGTILHARPPTSFTSFLHYFFAVNCFKLYIGEIYYLTDLVNTCPVRNNGDKPVAQYFNTANHSISYINVCAISPISGGNDTVKDRKTV